MNLFTTQEAGDAIVIRIWPQRFTVPEVDQFQREVIELVDRYWVRHLILDMSRMDFIDSSILGALIQIFKQVESMRGKLTLVGLQTRVKEILATTRLSSAFHTCDTVEAALRER